MKRWAVTAGVLWALLALQAVAGHQKDPGVDSVDQTLPRIAEREQLESRFGAAYQNQVDPWLELE